MPIDNASIKQNKRASDNSSRRFRRAVPSSGVPFVPDAEPGVVGWEGFVGLVDVVGVGLAGGRVDTGDGAGCG